MRKVFLDNVPKSKSEKTIKWNECVGLELKFVYDDVCGEFQVIEYKSDGKNAKLKLQYQKSTDWIYANQLKSGEISKFIGCKKKYQNKSINYKFEVGEEVSSYYDSLVIIDRKFDIDSQTGHTRKFYKYKCNKCGYSCGTHYKNGVVHQEYWLPERNIHGGQLCSCCTSRIAVPGINDIATVRPNMVDYFDGDTASDRVRYAEKYTPGSNQYINARCPHCGKAKGKYSINNIRNGHFSCICNDGISYPEKFMISVLEQLNVEYKHQMKFTWCKFFNPYKGKQVSGIYDFYINDIGLIIEMDGGYGHGFKKDTCDEDIFVDRTKDLLARKHNIVVVRIDSHISSVDFLKNEILKSGIMKWLDINSVDFEACGRFASSNLRATVINYFKKNDAISATELAKKYNLSVSTILRWLDLEGVEYFSHTGNKGKHNLLNSKKVNVNGVIYESASVFQERSLNDFGIIVNAESLKNAIRKGSTYKGLNVCYCT